MTTATEMLRRGQKREMWTKYCGFLDLRIDEFMRIQERLLMEQLNILGRSEIGQMFMGTKIPQSIDEFRKTAPITTYEDYEPYLETRREDVLPQPPFLWAHTSGRSGRLKWVPYTRQAYQRLGERVFAGVILASARQKGEIRIEENDTLVYNTPPRPFISGVALRAVADQFNFKFIPPLEKTEEMSFQERIEVGFQTAMVTGIDVLGSLSVVLVKMGERFAEGARSASFSRQMLHPRAIFRLARGYLRSKMEKRSMLPKDLWRIKALPCGGMDTAIYRDKIEYYWGATPYDQYGSTEEGAVATQTWNKKWMTFFPDAAFLEFIPENEWAKGQLDPGYTPKTVLLDEVELQMRYEVVLTNFYGKPLLRYRMHDMVEFCAFEDEETGVRLPQMVFVGRTNDFIDLAGYTGLIDEKMVWQAIVNTGVRFEDWAMRKESQDNTTYLHLYIETIEPCDEESLHYSINQQLKALNPFYADYEEMIARVPLEVTLLAPGTFRSFMLAKQAAGADLAHLKPAHMNTSADETSLLLQLSIEQNQEPARIA